MKVLKLKEIDGEEFEGMKWNGEGCFRFRKGRPFRF